VDVVKTGQVFVSHTSDMAARPAGRSFVQAALDAISRAGMAPVDMRYFAARDSAPADYCRARVRECEVFVAVVGFRYGSMVPNEAISYTELEFEEATKAGVPRLVFLLEDGSDLASGQAGAAGSGAAQFRQRLRDTGLVIRSFSNCDSLELEVFHALSELNRPGAAPSTARLASATRTLPRDVASFTGRERELAALVRAVTDVAEPDGVVGICAIGGMAGVGKTALAVHAAHRLAPQYPDGQIFLPLHGHTPGQPPVDPADALASLLQASGVSPAQVPAGLEPRAWLWRDHLAGKRVLLVLDDATGHEQVTPLLPGTAGSLVLITSRKRLKALEDARVVSLDTLPPDDAAALLVRLAGRAGLDPGDGAVREIARLCGYLPLAVGMLARQLHHHPVWTPDGLADDLAQARDRLEFMEAENLSVAAAFDLSYRDLPPGQQRVFRRLGLHPGTDIDVYAAAALDGTSLEAARRHLAGLYDAYVLAEPARGRYRMHDLIAEHARALAVTDEITERDAAIDRLMGYYLHASRSISRQYARRSPDGPPVMPSNPPASAPDLSNPRQAASWMDAEHANLHAATIYASSHGRPGYAIDIPAAVHGYLRHHGNSEQALTLHHAALDAGRLTGNAQAQASALTDIGDIHYMAANYPAAIASLTAALKLHRQQENQLGEANTLCVLGYVQYLTGDNGAAMETLTSALELHVRSGDLRGQAGSLAYLSAVHLAVGNYQETKAGLARAVEICGDLGISLTEAGVLTFLAEAQRATGDYPAARANMTRALELQRRIGNPLGEADSLRDLGYLHYAAGEFTEAIDDLMRSLELFRRFGHPRGEARALFYLGKIRYQKQEYAEATASFTQALDLYARIGQRLGEAEVLNAIGEVLLATGAVPEALARHHEARAIAAVAGSPPQEAKALEGMGRCLMSERRLEAAGAALLRALEIYEAISSPDASRVRELLDSIR
jgi:tetratricopeptide (TPR) repeat protein